MIDKILGFASKKFWIVTAILLSVVVAVLVFAPIPPLSFRMSLCTVKDETYVLHDTTYRLTTVSEKQGGKTIRLCVKEVVKTVKDNLVEKPV